MSEREFTEEELKQIEAEMERITVDDVLLQTLVTLLNLAARKGGLATPPGQEGPPPDLDQMRQAIEGARAVLPLVEQRHAEQIAPVRDTLAQLQMAYSQLVQAAPRGAGQPPEPGAGGPEGPPADPAGPGRAKPEGPGPAQQSGKLWIPGQ
jgi:hypothetical protein